VGVMMFNINPYAKFTKRSKYGNKKTVLGNVVYDSQKEANRAFELGLLLKAGEIKDLERQKRFELIPSQKDERGKVLFRPVVYIADFTYTVCNTGEKVVEDVKGFATSDFKLKQKMMYYFYHIKIRII
jgi:hypothetical protein